MKSSVITRKGALLILFRFSIETVTNDSVPGVFVSANADRYYLRQRPFVSSGGTGENSVGNKTRSLHRFLAGNDQENNVRARLGLLVALVLVVLILTALHLYASYYNSLPKISDGNTVQSQDDEEDPPTSLRDHINSDEELSPPSSALANRPKEETKRQETSKR